MKITRFSASKVHNHYNFEFNFFPDLSLLIGINGSGKTTALRLIQAMLTIDVATLQTIKFSQVGLYFEIERRSHSIEIQNVGNALSIFFDGQSADTRIPIVGDDERVFYQKSGRLDEHYEQLRIGFISSLGDPQRRLISGERPLFLGLERRTNRYDEEVTFADDHRIHSIRHVQPSRRSISSCSSRYAA